MKVLRVGLGGIVALLVALILWWVVAWLIVSNTELCVWPWSDILPGPDELCSIGR